MTADRIDASLEEFLALNARLIRRIANLRGAIETIRDGTAHGDPMREFCEQVLATDDKDRKRCREPTRLRNFTNFED